MITNIHNRKANILHFACNTEVDFPQIKESVVNNVLICPENLTIVTMFTDRKKAVLCDQLDNNNISYINACENVKVLNTKGEKTKHYIKALNEVTTDYVLIIDAYDCYIQSFDDIINKFNSYEKDIVYNAMQYNFPCEDIETCFDNIESPFCKLNSGVLIGKTNKVIEFYNKVLETYDTEPDGLPFEQYFIRKTIKDNSIENVGLDYNCDIALCTVCVKFDKNENDFIMLPMTEED